MPEYRLTDLKIDPEFERKIPPLTEEEFSNLRQNILEDNLVRDPIVIWDSTIVDGHNRFKILREHPEIPFSITEMEFTNRYDAIVWICRSQLGRRNLTLPYKRYLVGKQYEAEKASHGGLRGTERNSDGAFTASSQNGNLRSEKRTSERIAGEYGTSKNFVLRAESFAQGVDAAETALPGIRQQILSGTIKPTQSSLMAVAKASLDTLDDCIAKMQASCNRKSVPDTDTSAPTAGSMLSKVIEEIQPAESASEEDVFDELEDAFLTFTSRCKWCFKQNAVLLKTQTIKEHIIQFLSECEALISNEKENIANEIY